MSHNCRHIHPKTPQARRRSFLSRLVEEFLALVLWGCVALIVALLVDTLVLRLL